MKINESKTKTITIHKINITNKLINELESLFSNSYGYYSRYKSVEEMQSILEDVKNGLCRIIYFSSKKGLINSLEKAIKFCKDNNIKNIWTIDSSKIIHF